ncbi:MAG TPA: FCD domain-containing protein, partial [Geminicoccaceae bacterium]
HDVAFHRFLYGVSGNPLLADTAEPHWRYLRRVMGEVLRYAEPGPEIWGQHRGILDAVVRGDAVAAMERAERHFTGAAERLSSAFREGRFDGGSATARGARRRQRLKRPKGASTL